MSEQEVIQLMFAVTIFAAGLLMGAMLNEGRHARKELASVLRDNEKSQPLAHAAHDYSAGAVGFTGEIKVESLRTALSVEPARLFRGDDFYKSRLTTPGLSSMGSPERFKVSGIYDELFGYTVVVEAKYYDELQERLEANKLLLDHFRTTISEMIKADQGAYPGPHAPLNSTERSDLLVRVIELEDLIVNTKGWLPKHTEVYQAIDKIPPLAGGWEAWPDGGPGIGQSSRVDIRFRNGIEMLDLRVGVGAASIERFHWPERPQVDTRYDIVAIRRLPQKHTEVNIAPTGTIIQGGAYPIEPVGLQVAGTLSGTVQIPSAGGAGDE